MTTPFNRNETWAFEIIFTCPYCSTGHIAPEEFDIFRREEKNPQEGIHVSLQGTAVRIDQQVEPGNPAKQGTGIKIQFYCSNCKATPNLVIYQYEGQTFMDWKIKKEE